MSKEQLSIEEVRTLGFYQPFCSLMFHGKKETRWVRKGRKPPFPFGKYLFYSTKKKCENPILFQWCGAEIMLSIRQTLEGDDRMYFNGYALGTAVLRNIRLMVKEDEPLAFVKFVGERIVKDKKGNDVTQVQWILEFDPPIYFEQPFPFTEGKQGVGKFNLQHSKHKAMNREQAAEDYANKEWIMLPPNDKEEVSGKVLRSLTASFFLAGASWQASQSGEKGMRWRDASEIPPKGDLYFVKLKMKDCEDWFPDTCNYYDEWQVNEDYEVIAWLDEASESLPAPTDDRLREVIKRLETDVDYYSQIELTSYGKGSYEYARSILEILNPAALNPSTDKTESK